LLIDIDTDMQIHYFCFSSWKIMATDENPILSNLLNHLSQGKCHAAMPLFVDICTAIRQSRTILGSRRTSVFSANI